MKKLYSILTAVLLTVGVYAQSPEKMSYQAVIRDASDNLITNQAIGMQISILQGSMSGSTVYLETQTPITNANGLVSLEIGNGTIIIGSFAAIDWENGPFFIKTETDPTGGTSYTITGISQLLSVPYALHAKTAETVTGTITETDPVFEASPAAEVSEVDIYKLNNLSGVNTGDQDLSTLATKTELGDSTAQLRSEIPDITGLATTIAMDTALENKVDKVEGKGLSTEDYTTAEKTKLAAISGINTGDQDISGIATNATAISTIEAEQTTQNTAIALNTAKTGITPEQANAIIANTGKDTTGIYHANRTALNALSGVNTGDQDLSSLATKTALSDSIAQVRSEIPAAADGSETKVTAGTNVTVTGAGTTASPYVVNATGATALTIGQSYQGGIIFWLDATGQHGLIAATTDQSSAMQWYNGTCRYTGTTGDGLYAGAMNTSMIVATQMADNQTGNFAAKVCADYSVTVSGVTYGDWYLPSKYELNLLYLQKVAVGGFASAYYWSSTEDGSLGAWWQDFGFGAQGLGSKSDTHRVRAVRAF